MFIIGYKWLKLKGIFKDINVIELRQINDNNYLYF